MSSKTHLGKLDEFLTLLERFMDSIVEPQPNGEKVKQQFQFIENCFTNEILPIPEPEISPKLMSIWQGLLTEMNRNLRLVKTDLAFFEAALKAGKTPKHKRMQYHLDQMMAICSLCLNEG